MLASVDPDTGLKRLNPRWQRAFMGLACDFIEIDPTCIQFTDLDQILQDIDGVLLTGGDINIPPEFYGQRADETQQRRLWNGNIPQYPFYRRRFEVSRHIIQYAEQTKTPLLAVCLGAQEVNVVFGGQHRQEIKNHLTKHADTDDRWDEPHHDIIVEPDSLLAKCFGEAGQIPENSVHKQGIVREELAKKLRIEAMAEDGRIVEAFSLPEHPFFLCTQFHVESTKPYPGNKRIFSAFIGEAKHKLAERVQALLQIDPLQRECLDMVAE